MSFRISPRIAKAVVRYNRTKKEPQATKQVSHPSLLTNLEKLDHLPKPVKGFRTFFKGIDELYISGAGGAGPGFIGALQEAIRFGLRLDKLKVVCGTSAGSIIGLAIVLGMSPEKMIEMLLKMPTDKFQDWSLASIFKIPQKWGLCEGKYMTNYFKDLIKECSGLDNPTFAQLHQAGFDKEFRVVVNNVSKCKMETWSYKTTPHMSVAEAVATSCNLPFVFPPKWYWTKSGDLDAYTDGGVMCHYPLREGSPNTPPEKQLGLVIVNRSAALTINDEPRTFLETIWDYFGRLFTMLFYRDPLCMDQAALNQSVTISVDHNPLKFKLSHDELTKLLFSGRKALLEYVRRLITFRAEGPKKGAHPIEEHARPVLFTCGQCRRKLATSKKLQQNMQNKMNALKRKRYGTGRSMFRRRMANVAR